MHAAQQTTAPIITAATGPIDELLPRNAASTSAANRMVAIVMPDTGLFDVPTRPAMYADTEQNRNPAMIMITDIARATPTLPPNDMPAFFRIHQYRNASGIVNSTVPMSTDFMGRSRSVCATIRALPARAASRPLFTPDTIDPRSVNSVHRPPISIAPTPR